MECNQRLVNSAAALLAVYSGEKRGGTAATLHLSILPEISNYKLNDKLPELCYDTINRQPKPNFRKGDADMKAMTSANFYYECEQAIFQSEKYSCSEVRPYQDKQQLAGLST